MLSEDLRVVSPPSYERLLEPARGMVGGAEITAASDLAKELWRAGVSPKEVAKAVLFRLFGASQRWHMCQTQAAIVGNFVTAFGSDISIAGIMQGRRVGPHCDAAQQLYGDAMQRWRALARLRPPVVLGGSQRVTTIFIFGPIGSAAALGPSSVLASALVPRLDALKTRRLVVLVNSCGGNAVDACLIHDALRRHPASVDVVIEGAAMSAGSLVAMAGDRVSMRKGALLMLHGPLSAALGFHDDLQRGARALRRMTKLMARIYARRSGNRNAAAVLAMLRDGQDHYLTAREAKALGLVDQILS